MPAGAAGLPPDFVYLGDVAPEVRQEMRYAGDDNFVGRPLPGYDAAECVLRRDAAAALRQVQAEAAEMGLSLKVFDCYRPAQAVAAMAAWAAGGESGEATRRFFPRLEKSRLFALGYIAERSAHSTGLAVDLTLVVQARPALAALTPHGLCTGPASERSAADEFDMGTGFDCFDSASHAGSPDISAEQSRNRARLAGLMRRHGFKGYRREWWHFTFAAPENPGRVQSAPIARR